MSFEKAVKNFEKQTLAQLQRVRRAVVLEILSGVVIRTPVDTGRARANWLVTVGKPANYSSLDTDKGGFATIHKAEAVRLGQMGDVVFITNNLPYIEALNDGHSGQAERGYIQSEVQRVKNNLTRGGFTVGD